MPDAVLIQLARFVVERCHPHTLGPSANILAQPAHDVEAVGGRSAQSKHELFEVVAREVAVPPEHRLIEILVERDLPRLEGADGFLVPILKVFPIQPETKNRVGPLLAIPSVGSEHTANVEEQLIDDRHPIRTARDGAPSIPASSTGRQYSSYVPAGGSERSRPSTITLSSDSRVLLMRRCA